MSSSLIPKIQVALREHRLEIRKEHVNSLRKFFNNARRNPRDRMTELNRQFLKRGPFRLQGDFNDSSLVWMREMVLRKDGEPRDTPVTRRMSKREIAIVQDLACFQFVGMWEDWDSAGAVYEANHHPGHEWITTYCMFRAVSSTGAYFTFYNIPWQNHDVKATGIFIVPEWYIDAVRDDKAVA